MMKLNQKQIDTVNKIKSFAPLFGLDPAWPIAVAMVESSLGLNQYSPTGCKGVFQISSIAMKDLLIEMQRSDDDLIDIACGVAFLFLLLKRHKTIEAATAKFCDPADKGFYVDKVRAFIKELQEDKK